jgi:hypothetical protein
MPDRPLPSVEEIITLCKKLSPEDQQKVRQSLVGPVQDQSVANWVTLEETAAELGKSKSQISRDAKAGKLLTNGKIGRHLRIHRLSKALAHGIICQQCLNKFRNQRNVRAVEDQRFHDLLDALLETGQQLISAYKWLIENGIDPATGNVDSKLRSKFGREVERYYQSLERFFKRAKEKYGLK